MAEPFSSQEELVDFFRKTNAATAFRQANQESRRLERILGMQGVQPEELEDRPNAFMRALDAIGTPSQAVRGALAKFIGTPGYGDLSVLDAVRKGTKENVTTGDILRANDVLTSGSLPQQVGRGMLSFLGDVVTDPLTYVTTLSSGAKVGGKALAKEPVRMVTGETLPPQQVFERLVASSTDDAVRAAKESLLKASGDTNWEQFLGKPGNAVLADDILSLAQAKAANAARRPASEARALIDYARRQLPRDISVLGDDAVKAQLAKETVLKKKLGLADDVPLDALFDDAGIRLLSPFSGKTTEIPVVTDLSRKAFRALDGAYYNAKLNIKQQIPEGVTQALTVLPKAVSQEINAGSVHRARNIDELRIAHGAAMAEAQVRVGAYAKKLQDAGFNEDDLRRFQGVLHSYQSELGKLAKGRGKDVRMSSLKLSSDDLQKTEENIARALAQYTDPVKRQAAGEFFSAMKSRMAEMAKIEADAGLGDYFVDVYLPGLREKATDPLTADLITKAARRQSKLGAAPDFTFAKTFATIAEAENMGIEMVKDPIRLWEHREFQHARALAEKEFLERFAFQYGVPEALRQTVSRLAANESDEISRKAIGLLKEWDVPITPDDLLSGFRAPKDLPLLRTATGDIMTPAQFDALVMRADPVVGAGGAEGRIARQQAKKLGIRLDNPELLVKQREAITQVRELYDQYKARQLGRAGESLSTRAGGLQISDKVKKALFNNATAEEKRMLNGILPSSFVRALEEGLDTRNLVRTVGDTLKAQGKTPEASILYRAANQYTNWVRLLKKGALQWWPSYHFGNTLSIPFLQGPEMSLLGESLSIKNLLRTQRLLDGKNLSIVQQGTGRTIPMSQLAKEARLYFPMSRDVKPLELIEMQSDILDQLGSKTVKSNKWGLLGKLDEKLGTMSNYVESFGRAQLYYTLRERGFDPASASERVNQLFTNYLGNKTRFERTLLNNTIFFYSFAKAQAVNTLANMVTRPGAVTQQVHAFNGIAEALTDPNLIPMPEDLEAQAQTTRSREVLSRFVGRSKSGLPQVLSGVGMPLDSVSQLVGLKLPKNFTWGELLGAAGESAGRTSQLILSATNPVIKKTLENVVSGQNLFFDRPVDDKTLRRVARVAPMIKDLIGYDPNSIPGQVVKTLDAGTRELLGAVDNGDGTWTANPTRLAILAVLVPGAERFISTLNAAQNPGIESSHKWMRYLSRARVQEIDPNKAIIFDRNKRLKKKAEELGLATSFSKLRQKQALLAAQEEEE